MGWKTKDGEVISWKEFFKRWGQGIEGISQLQKLKAQNNGYFLQLIGLLLGFVVAVLNYESLWWLAIVLFGALIVTGVAKIGVKQQMIQLQLLELESEERSLEELFEEEEGGEE